MEDIKKLQVINIALRSIFEIISCDVPLSVIEYAEKLAVIKENNQADCRYMKPIF